LDSIAASAPSRAPSKSASRPPAAKGLLKDHLHIDDRALDGVVFPDSDAVKPMAGLVA
jgi:uncharacterized protein (DUF1501 family)